MNGNLKVSNGKHAVYLDKFISTKYESKMNVKNIAIFWNFFRYWTFNIIGEKLGESNIQLERNRYDNTCKIRSAKLNFGPLLGFPVNKVIQPNTWTNSPSNVDINLGLRYVTVECNCVDTDRNFDSNGRRSKVIATVPITSEQSLNSSVTFCDNISSKVSVLNGDHNMFELDVNTNISNKVDLTILFELYVE